MKYRSIFEEALLESFNTASKSLFLHNSAGESITYTQATKKVKDNVAKLKQHTPEIPSVIGIYSEKNIPSTLFIYSVVLNAKGYLPLDIRSPFSRVITILQEAKPAALFVQEKFVQLWLQELANKQIEFSVIEFEPGYQLFVFPSYKTYPIDILYVLYTSGSTGTPKGIIQTGMSGWNFTIWCGINLYHNHKRFISIAPYQFDLSIFDLFFSVDSDASLLLPTETEAGNSRLMAQLIADNDIDILYATPSFFNWLMDTGRLEKYDFAPVKTILIAGEKLYWETIKRLRKYFPNAEMYNLYGPTETNVCMNYKIDFADAAKYPNSVPIGKPCRGCQMELNPTNNGDELLIAGRCLMESYVNDKENKNEPNDGRNFYATGDIVEEAFDGNYAFVSRADRMIKRNGFRIEPTEIEMGLKKLEGVKQVVVVPHSQNSSTELFAFLVSEKKYETVFLRNYCADNIQYYMVPDRFVFIDEIPLNANHKVNVNELIHLTKD